MKSTTQLKSMFHANAFSTMSFLKRQKEQNAKYRKATIEFINALIDQHHSTGNDFRLNDSLAIKITRLMEKQHIASNEIKQWPLPKIKSNGN